MEEALEQTPAAGGRTAYIGYSANEGAILALAAVDSACAEPGTEVAVLRGEAPNSTRPQVEQVEGHVQVAVRATVQPAPLTEFARAATVKGLTPRHRGCRPWRTEAR